MMSPRRGESHVSERYPPKRPPLVLIINAHEWSTRSLESILWPNGYAVVRAYTGRQALERVRSSRPDLIFIDSSLPDFDSLELCSAIRVETTVLDSTPILMTSTDRPTRDERLGALRAGAWDYLSYPLDAEELMLRLDSYMRAKFDADHAREKALVDETTGLYTIRGLERRAAELGSHAFRYHWPFACVVVAPDVTDHRNLPLLRDAVRRMAASSRDVLRTSDAVGQLGESQLAIIAPGTDAGGAVKLAERLSIALNGGANGSGQPQVKLRAGYHAVADYHEDPVEPMDMLAHATEALNDESLGGQFRAFGGEVH